MAFRTWAQTLGTAAGAAFLAAAGQLGVGSGLGLLRWDGDFTDGAAWHTQIGWLAFLTALATVAGAAVGRWAPAGFAGTSAAERQPPWARVALAVAAAVGAAIFIPIGARPAHGVHIPVAGSAATTAILAMLAGLALGIAVAYAVLSIPAVGGNVVTCAVWLWLAALASCLWSLRQHDTIAGAPVTRSAARLGLLPPAGAVSAAVLLLGVPAAIGLVAALVSRFGGGGRWAVAGSGAAGPLLVAGAYVIAGPGGGSHTVAYWCSIGGVATGVAASAFVALARRTGPETAPAADYPAARWDEPGDGSTGARHAASNAPEDDSDLPAEATSASGWPDSSTGHGPPDETSSTPGWPDSSSTASTWSTAADTTSAWPASPSTTSADSYSHSEAGSSLRWSDSSTPSGSTNWPDSSSTAAPSHGWSSSEAARRWLDGGSGAPSTDGGLLDADTGDLAAQQQRATGPDATSSYSSVDEVERAENEASDRAVAALWGERGTAVESTSGYAPPAVSSRPQPTFFESAPAPDVPAAPTSRGRSGTLFDADPMDAALDDEPVVTRGRHADSGELDAPAGGDTDTDAVAPTSPGAGGAPEDAPVAEQVPAGRSGRRGRRAKEAQQSPVIRAKDTEYVDWFKDLRGSGRDTELS